MSWFHRHIWKIISINHIEEIDYDASELGFYVQDSERIGASGNVIHKVIMKDMTVFIQECIHCHKLQQKTMNGYHDLIIEEENNAKQKKKITG